MDYPIFKVGVVGGGTMGGGIAALVARQGLPVVVKEGSDSLAESARKKIHGRFQSWYNKNKIDGHRLEELKSLVEVTSDSEALADVDLFIEAVPENLELKKKIFIEFDGILPSYVIMASNTSSLPITELGKVTKRSDRVIGMHFFNPPTTMILLEVVNGQHTSAETLLTVEDFARTTLQKTTIKVMDRPGFLLNCLLIPYLNEPVLALEQSLILPEQIDAEARKYGWPMGPFTLLDFVGIDVALFVSDFLVKSYPERLTAPSLFKIMVDDDRLGDKSGAGFYNLDESRETLESILSKHFPNRTSRFTSQDVFKRMMASFLNEAVGAVEDGVASKEDIELGAQAGIGCPYGGPLHIIDKMGPDTLLLDLLQLEREFGTRFKPRKLLEEVVASGQTFFSSR